jgi:WD40 repeat protein
MVAMALAGLFTVIADPGPARSQEPKKAVAPRSRLIRAHKAPVVALAFSPDGQTLATTAGVTGIYAHNIIVGYTKERRFSEGKDGPGEVETPSGPIKRRVVENLHSSEVKVWEVANVHLRARIPGNSGIMTCVAFSPDGKWLAVGSDNHGMIKGPGEALRLLNTRTWKEDAEVPSWPGDDVHSLTFFPDGARLFLRRDGGYEVWDWNTLERRAEVVEGYAALEAGFRAEPVRRPHNLSLLRLPRPPSERPFGSVEPMTPLGPPPAVLASGTSTDGKVLAIARRDQVLVRDTTAGNEVARLSLPAVAPTSITAAAVAPDGSAVAAAFTKPPGISGGVGAGTSGIAIWEVDPQRQRVVLDLPQTEWVTALAFSPDAKLLAGAVATSDPASVVVLWSTDTGRRTASLGRGIGRLFRCLTFSPDGTLLSAGDTQGAVWIWASHGVGK